MVPYLLVADLQNTALSAILVFSDRLLYPSYAIETRLFGFPALHDQAASGAIMWVLGSLAYLVPAMVIAIHCLQHRPLPAEVAPSRKREASCLDTLLTLPQRFSFANRWLRPPLSLRTIEATSFLILFAIAGLGLAGLVSRSSHDDDDQVLRLQQQSGPFAVAVFAQPGDLEAGPSTFAVLVQDAETQETLLDANVDLSAQQGSDLSSKISVRATPADSENKLLKSAELNFPTAGDWTVHIGVQRDGASADFALPVHVVKPASVFAIPWSYLILLACTAILLFVYLRRHRPEKIARIEQPVSTLQ
jgi:hypothetical protein